MAHCCGQMLMTVTLSARVQTFHADDILSAPDVVALAYPDISSCVYKPFFTGPVCSRSYVDISGVSNSMYPLNHSILNVQFINITG